MIGSMSAPYCQFQIKALPSLARLRLLNVLRVRLRRLNPRRLGFIFDLKLELLSISYVINSSTLHLIGRLFLPFAQGQGLNGGSHAE